MADYLDMLRAEQRRETFNKAEHWRALLPLLPKRTKAAIERKHQNVSMIANQLGFPSIDGYKPLGNYQKLLFEVAEVRFRADAELATLLQKNFTALAVKPATDDWATRRVSPPKGIEGGPVKPSSMSAKRLLRNVSYLELEVANRSLGKAGEEWVVDYERDRLRRAGRAALADRVEHVAVTIGDGLGFDVRSFEVGGADRMIEVKTTASHKETPFFVTRNELSVSRGRSHEFHLYRVFHFRDDPRFFSLTGPLDQSCLLDPVLYSTRVR